jgi:hypothetical protein
LSEGARVAQARVVLRVLAEARAQFNATHLPLVLTGDLNSMRGSRTWRTLAGARVALAEGGEGGTTHVSCSGSSSDSGGGGTGAALHALTDAGGLPGVRSPSSPPLTYHGFHGRELTAALGARWVSAPLQLLACARRPCSFPRRPSRATRGRSGRRGGPTSTWTLYSCRVCRCRRCGGSRWHGHRRRAHREGHWEWDLGEATKVAGSRTPPTTTLSLSRWTAGSSQDSRVCRWGARTARARRYI